MFRRYVLPSVLIMTIALGTAVGVYEAGTSVIFGAPCGFQAFIHLSQDAPRTPDDQKLINALAAQAVTTAIGAGVYNQVAKAQKVRPATLAANVSTTPAPGLGVFFVVVNNPDPKTAIRLVNATCEHFVTTIKNQRAKEIEAQVGRVKQRVASIQAEIRRLAAIKRPTQSDQANLFAQRAALTRNQLLIANIISLPPDDVSVLTRAASTVRKDTTSLRKNLVIAGIAGLLACFLYILGLEVITEQKRKAARNTLKT